MVRRVAYMLSKIFPKFGKHTSSIDMADALRKSLLKSHSDNPNFITDEKTGLVVEGYPRSANSFLVRLIAHQLDQNGLKKLKIGHHTHKMENLKLAIIYEKPIVVVMRKPVDAISSCFIYHQNAISLSQCAKNYDIFYSFVKKNNDKFIVAAFDTVTTDPNRIFSALHDKYKLAIPMVDDFGKASQNIFELIRNRSRQKNADHHIYKAPVPSQKRKVLKEKIVNDVEKLCQKKNLDSLYDAIKKF